LFKKGVNAYEINPDNSNIDSDEEFEVLSTEIYDDPDLSMMKIG